MIASTSWELNAKTGMSGCPDPFGERLGKV